MTQENILSFIQKINWEKSPLIPSITQQYDTQEVLMLGFMNQEALALTLKTSFVHYFSRTKERIWKKGETSGHTQKLLEVFLDCDNDTLLLKVDQKGRVCHTGAKTCFFQKLDLESSNLEEAYEKQDLSNKYGVIDSLYHTLQDRKNASPETSYSASLYHKGENTIGKKIVEEAAEFSFAIKDNDKQQIIYECADLIYHTLVGLSYKNIYPDLIKKELKKRFSISGIEEKNSRK